MENLNIVYFICHDLGRQLGTYGLPIGTDNIDAFAASGITFDNAHCSNPCCMPSRSSAMTGLYSHNHGCLGTEHGWTLPSEVDTIVDYFNRSGRETINVGGDHERRPKDKSANPMRYSLLKPRVYGSSPSYFVENSVQEAIDVLSSRPKGSGPFYLNVFSQDPHMSTWAGVLMEKYHREAVYGVDPLDDAYVHPSQPDNKASREIGSRFYPCIRHVDREFGKLVAAIDRLGLRENTLVIFATDHGMFGNRDKQTVYDTGTEISLIARLPGVIKPNTRTNALISNIDLVPTLLEATGLDIPPTLPGRSFWPLMVNDSYEPSDHIFTERNYHVRYDPVRTIRTSRYHYLINFHPRAKKYLNTADILSSKNSRYREGNGIDLMGRADFWEFDKANWPERTSEELYDVQADPYETVNLAYEPGMQEIRQRMARELETWMVQSQDFLVSQFYPRGMFEVPSDFAAYEKPVPDWNYRNYACRS